jgi:hypothetical protein
MELSKLLKRLDKQAFFQVEKQDGVVKNKQRFLSQDRGNWSANNAKKVKCKYHNCDLLGF